MKGLSSLVLVGLATLAAAQKPKVGSTHAGTGSGKTVHSPQSTVHPSTSRVDAILDAANDRLSTQIDAMFEDGDFPAVIELLKIQAEGYPADYDIWTNLGWMEENVEQWDAALATYVRYKRQNPNDPDRALPEANFYFMRRIYAKVPPLMEPAIKGGKTHANAYRILARSYEKEGMLGDALRVYKALVERDPDDGAAKANVKRVEGKINGGK